MRSPSLARCYGMVRVAKTHGRACLSTLMRSIKGVGLWGGVIARKASNRCQIAFARACDAAARLIAGGCNNFVRL